jgi:cardiolipin synthase
VLNLPNFLTVVRILTIPGFLILLVNGHSTAALIVFVAGGLTDALDGAIARLTNTKTELGAVLDPLADKLLLLSSFCVLAFMERVPNWLVIIVIMRDVILLTGYFTLFMVSGDRMAVRPSVIGKATTFLQLFSVTIVLVGFAWPESTSPGFRSALFTLTGVATAVSGVQYVARGLRWLGLPAATRPVASDEPVRRRQSG